MDKGRGSGYRNLIPRDRPVHQMSGKGMKQPQLRLAQFGLRPRKLGTVQTIRASAPGGDDLKQRLRPLGIRFVKTPPLGLKNRLPVQVGIIVPSTKNVLKAGKSVSVPIPKEEWDDRIREEKEWFSKRFGGDTSIEGMGSYWDDEQGSLVKERNVIVTGSTTVAKYNRFRRELAAHTKSKQKEWAQSTVFLRIEGQDYIYPKKDFIDDDKGQQDIIPVA